MAWSQADASRPRLLIFHPASVEAAHDFFAQRAPETPVASDREHRFYKGFGLRRGTLLELFGPRAFGRGLAALFRGHFVGKPAGNTLLMPGAFLVDDDQVLFQHRAAHAGDHPELASIEQIVSSRARAG